MSKVAIVSPCFNEEEIISDFISQLVQLPQEYEIIIVNDGSTDNTVELIKSFNRVKLIDLKRNVGQQKAMLAGLKAASEADIIVTLDSDLQDDPKYIEDLVRMINLGYDYVACVRVDRQSDTFLKRFMASVFYALLKYKDSAVIKNHGDYRAMSGDLLRKYLLIDLDIIYLRGQLPALAERIGFVNIIRKKRMKGQTKYTLSKMFRLALDAFTS